MVVVVGVEVLTNNPTGLSVSLAFSDQVGLHFDATPDMSLARQSAAPAIDI
jgi:hypothetical protein